MAYLVLYRIAYRPAEVAGDDFVNLLFVSTDVGRFVLCFLLKDLDEFSIFLLIIVQVLHKYMRIHLSAFVWHRLCVMRNVVLCEVYSYVKL